MSVLNRRVSKVRHVFDKPAKKGCTFDIKPTTQPWETNMSSVNEKFLAVAVESSGGGAFAVLPVDKPGRYDSCFKVCGHKDKVLDIAWNPFNTNQIASSSEDCCICIWNIPDGDLRGEMKEPAMRLEIHERKVGMIAWNPTAENILAAACCAKITIWDISEPDEPAFEIPVSSLLPDDSCVADSVCSLDWNRDGSRLLVAIKGPSTNRSNIFVIDPRNSPNIVVSHGLVHSLSKVVKAEFCGKYVFTTGASGMDKTYALWNPLDFTKSLTTGSIGTSSGVAFFYYDDATKIIFVLVKGGSTVMIYELIDEAPYIQWHNSLKMNGSHRGACFSPKRCLNFMDCEVFRFYRLCNSNVEPVSMIIPRKSGLFQSDIFPPCEAGLPALSTKEWLQGVTKQPIMRVINKDGLGERVDGVAIESLAPSTGSLSKQSSVSSNSSDTRKDIPTIVTTNTPSSLTSSGEFDDSQYRKDIQTLQNAVDSLKRENESLKSELQKKEATINSIKKLVQ